MIGFFWPTISGSFWPTRDFHSGSFWPTRDPKAKAEKVSIDNGYLQLSANGCG